MNCRNCSQDISDLEEKCPTCGWYAGPPNVRIVSKTEERNALELRYKAAIDNSFTNGSNASLLNFEAGVKITSAIVNMDLDYLHQFLTNDKPLYATYSLMVAGQVRKPATNENDAHRRTIEAMLFGGYAEQIRYAALSLDGSGPKSYGGYSVNLREITIADRATLLENNSYHFVPLHNLQPGDAIPLGYRSVWREKHKLAVSKLSAKIFSSTLAADYPKILLSGTGDRAGDDFIEVHIYGAFDNKAIEAVKGSSRVKSKLDRARVSEIKDYLHQDGKLWIEE